MIDDAPTEPIPVLNENRVPASPLPNHLGDRALTLGAVLGTLFILTTAAALVFGVRPVIFETSSMSPTIPVGSLGLAKSVPANQLRAGDVATVLKDDGTRVTHRVVSVDAKSSVAATLTMRGDANPTADPKPYIVADAQRILFTVPAAGYVAAWLRNPFTIALQTIGAGALLLIAFAPKRGWRRSRTARRLLSTTAVAVSVSVAATGVVDPGQAHAADSFAAAAGQLTTGLPDNPTSLTCTSNGTLLGGSATLSWPNPTSHRNRYTYVLVSGGQVVATIAPGTTDPAAVTITQGLLSSILGSLLGQSADVTLYNRVGNFQSSAGLTQGLTVRLLFPTGVQCAISGTVGTSALQRRSTASTSSSVSTPSSAASTPSIDESAPSNSATATPLPHTDDSTASPTTPRSTSTTTTPLLPPDGTPTTSDAFAFYQDGTKVTIRDAKTTDVVYTGRFSSAATVRWLPGTEKLEITEPDGTVTVVTQQGDNWIEDVTAPAPTTTSTTEPAEPTIKAEPTETERTVTPTESVVPSE